MLYDSMVQEEVFLLRYINFGINGDTYKSVNLEMSTDSVCNQKAVQI